MTRGIIIFLLLALGGCADQNLHDSGPNLPVADLAKSAIEQVDLVRELTPPGENWNTARQCVQSATNDCMAGALNAFYAEPTNQRLRRNRVQASLRKASDRQCDHYLQFLNEFQSKFNFFSGSAATALAGVSTIVTNTEAARLFAGLAGISSGLRAEFNSDIFYQQAVPILVTAIGTERQTQRTEMDRRWNLELDAYPVELAIADALRYHGACSLVSGLSHVQLAVNFQRDPGIEGLNRALVKVNAGRLIQDRRISDLSLLNADGSINGGAGAAYGLTPATQLSVARDPANLLARALADELAFAATVRTRIAAAKATDASKKDADTKVANYSTKRIANLQACSANATAASLGSQQKSIELASVAASDVAAFATAQKALADAQTTADSLARAIDAARNLDATLFSGFQNALGSATDDAGRDRVLATSKDLFPADGGAKIAGCS